MKQKVSDMLEVLKKTGGTFAGKIRNFWSVMCKKETLYWLVPALIVIVALIVFVARPTNNVSVDVEVGADTQKDSEESTLTAGTYTSGMLPAASSPGREFTLVLAEDGVATFTGDYKKGEKLVVETGTWSRTDNRVTLTLVTRFGFPLEQSVTHTFEVSEGSLVLVDYDVSRWGSLGLTLKRSE